MHITLLIFRRLQRNPGIPFWLSVCFIYARHSTAMLPLSPLATLLELWAWVDFTPKPSFMLTLEDQVRSKDAGAVRLA